METQHHPPRPVGRRSTACGMPTSGRKGDFQTPGAEKVCAEPPTAPPYGGCDGPKARVRDLCPRVRPSQEQTCRSLAGAARGDCHNRRSEGHILTPPLRGGATARRLMGTPLREGGAAASQRDDVEEEVAHEMYCATILIPVLVPLEAYAEEKLRVGRLVEVDDVNI